MKTKLRRLKILKEIFHCRNEKKVRGNRYLYLCVMFVLSSILLCSCQKSPQAIVRISPPSGQNTTDELRVKDGNYQEALKRCQERLQLLQEDSLEAADVYSIMGEIYVEYLEDSYNAVHYINKAIEIHKRENDELGLALDYKVISKKNIYIDKDAEEGMRNLEKAEQIYCKYGVTDAFEMASVYSDQGQIYKSEGQYEEALKVFKKAQEIYEKRQEENISLHLLIGQVYLEMQEYTLAEEQYLEAQKICKKEGNQYSMAEVEFQLGWLYRNMKEYSQAIEHYNQALEFYQKNKIYLYDTANTYNNISRAYDELGELEKALEVSVCACRTIENLDISTSEKRTSIKIYKHNLSMYYMAWSKYESKEGFDAWYQKVVMEEQDWKE